MRRLYFMLLYCGCIDSSVLAPDTERTTHPEAPLVLMLLVSVVYHSSIHIFLVYQDKGACLVSIPVDILLA